METYKLDFSNFTEEAKKSLYWEVQVENDEIRIFLCGGALEPVALSIKGKDMVVDDWWEWGAG